LTDAGWTEVGYTSRDGIWFDESHEFRAADLTALQDRINKAATECSWPSQRWMTGVGPHWWPQSVELPGNTSSAGITINERSKPMGLTKEHAYKDNFGDAVKVSHEVGDNFPLIETDDGAGGVYIDAETAVPLALNVLGHDRPSLGDLALTSTVVVRGDGHRDELLAQAAANLRAIDLYDQHVAKKKADEVAAAEAARGHDARLTRVKETRAELHSAARHLSAAGVLPSSLNALKGATERYEAAQDALRRGVDL
jgi:hypothetical protein